MENDRRCHRISVQGMRPERRTSFTDSFWGGTITVIIMLAIIGVVLYVGITG